MVLEKSDMLAGRVDDLVDVDEERAKDVDAKFFEKLSLDLMEAIGNSFNFPSSFPSN